MRLHLNLLKAYAIGYSLAYTNERPPAVHYSALESIAIQQGFSDGQKKDEYSIIEIITNIQLFRKKERIVTVPKNKMEFDHILLEIGLEHRALNAYKISDINSILWSAELIGKKYETLLVIKNRTRFLNQLWYEHFQSLTKIEYAQETLKSFNFN